MSNPVQSIIVRRALAAPDLIRALGTVPNISDEEKNNMVEMYVTGWFTNSSRNQLTAAVTFARAGGRLTRITSGPTAAQEDQLAQLYAVAQSASSTAVAPPAASAIAPAVSTAAAPPPKKRPSSGLTDVETKNWELLVDEETGMTSYRCMVCQKEGAFATRKYRTAHLCSVEHLRCARSDVSSDDTDEDSADGSPPAPKKARGEGGCWEPVLSEDPAVGHRYRCRVCNKIGVFNPRDRVYHEQSAGHRAALRLADAGK